ncbi:MAG: DUF5519 family protein [bacterium]|nr:DUF5519 family protein [bacterium]
MNVRILLATLLLFAYPACSKEDTPTSNLDSDSPSLPLTQVANLLSTLSSAPSRQGPAPQTSKPVPHQQLDQNAPFILQETLLASIDKLNGITVASTTSSLSGSWGWYLDENLIKTGGPRAFLGTNEFGHSHNSSDGSLHLFLLANYAQIVLEKGWGELHPNDAQMAGQGSHYMMIYGPRDRTELDAIWMLVQASYAFATGQIK